MISWEGNWKRGGGGIEAKVGRCGRLIFVFFYRLCLLCKSRGEQKMGQTILQEEQRRRGGVRRRRSMPSPRSPTTTTTTRSRSTKASTVVLCNPVTDLVVSRLVVPIIPKEAKKASQSLRREGGRGGGAAHCYLLQFSGLYLFPSLIQDGLFNCSSSFSV